MLLFASLGLDTIAALHPSSAPETPAERDRDSDGDGLSNFQEIHKYRTDPSKFSTAGDGVSDGDWQRRREFTYTIRSIVKVMPPLNLKIREYVLHALHVLSGWSRGHLSWAGEQV